MLSACAFARYIVNAAPFAGEIRWAVRAFSLQPIHFECLDQKHVFGRNIEACSTLKPSSSRHWQAENEMLRFAFHHK